MNTILTLLLVIVLLVVAFFFYQGWSSANASAPGLEQAKLMRCSEKPNCACSEYPDDQDHFVEPLGAVSIDAIVEAVAATGGEIVSQDSGDSGLYVSARYTSGLFRFVDDVEFRADPAQDVVHVRSASRVGYSDFGANMKRIAAIREWLGSRTASQG